MHVGATGDSFPVWSVTAWACVVFGAILASLLAALFVSTLHFAMEGVTKIESWQQRTGEKEKEKEGEGEGEAGGAEEEGWLDFVCSTCCLFDFRKKGLWWSGVDGDVAMRNLRRVFGPDHHPIMWGLSLRNP